MNDYLGISMVIIVAGLVIAVLARLVTGGILDEIERIRKNRSVRNAKIAQELMKDAVIYFSKFNEELKKTDMMEKQAIKNGATIEEMEKTGFECAKKIFEDLK